MLGPSYTARELFEIADEAPERNVHLGHAGSITGVITGVVIPGGIAEGELIGVERARKLAAQMLRACELHDAISDEAARPYIERQAPRG